MQMKKRTKRIIPMILSVFIICMSVSFPSDAANNKVLINDTAIGITYSADGIYNSTTFTTIDTYSYSSAREMTKSGFVTVYYTFDSLPAGNFDITLNYNFYPDASTSFVLQGITSWSSGTSYNGVALKHATAFYKDFGGDNMQVIPYSTRTSNTLTFHVNGFEGGMAAISVCFYVNVKHITDYSYDIMRWVANSVTYTTSDEQIIDGMDQINDSLDSITTPSDSDQVATDEFHNNVNNQTGELDNLVNDMESMNKVDVDSVTDITSGAIDSAAVSEYGDVLSIATDNKIILQYLIILFSIGLCAYVLYGKRG